MPRPVTRFLCRWVPRRKHPRIFTANDAARIVCKAIQDGATRAEIEGRINEKCASVEHRIVVGAPQNSLQLAVEALEENNSDWLTITNAVSVANGILLGLILVLQFTPVRLVGIPLKALRTALGTFGKTAARRREENDAFIKFMEKVIVRERELQSAHAKEVAVISAF